MTLRLRRLIQKMVLASRLGQLHAQSQHMKRKLRILARRQRVLIRDIERLQSEAGSYPTPAGRRTPDNPQNTMSSSAIWIHSTWRAGSTYFWSKFRASPDYVAFYEPFHESLETLTETQISGATAESWPSGHPPLHAPYYAEYLPLLRPEGGVVNFEHTFPYNYYFLNEDSLPEQQAYLQGLCTHAQTLGRRPVLGFCRSPGRAAWFARTMSGVHIALTRDGLGLWRSALDRSQTRGDWYFLARPLIILMAARRDSWVEEYFKDLELDGLPRFVDAGLATKEAMRTVHQDPLLTMRAFTGVSALALALSQRYADIVISMEMLSTEVGCRAVSAELAGRYHIDLDWRDCAIPIYPVRDEDEGFLHHWREASRLAQARVFRVPGSPPQNPPATALNRRAAAQKTGNITKGMGPPLTSCSDADPFSAVEQDRDRRERGCDKKRT